MRCAVAVLIALLPVAACGIPQPSNTEVDAPPGADDAAAIVVQEWSERLDVELDLADLPPVRWFEGECLDYDDGYQGCADGGYSTAPGAASEIHVIARSTFHESRLAHEVLHWGLDRIGAPDADDHSDPIWRQVAAVEHALTGAGL
jgi:hypothetical protein